MSDKSDDLSLLNDSVDVDIEPDTTTLEDLLNLANDSKAGTIALRGEDEDGKTQWGIVVTCSEDAKGMMDALEVTMEEMMSKWLAARAN